MNSSSDSSKKIHKAFVDFVTSFSYWRIFYLIGIGDIRRRYSRSKLGQLWLTLSLAVQIGSLGFVWGYLFKMPLADYFPYLAISIIFWNFILSSITEGANIYINSIAYLKELTIPKLSYINSLFVKNIIILLHNLVVLIPIFLYCGVMVSFGGICFSLLGFVVLCISLYLTIIPISLLSLRFRDFPNIIISLSQIIFYVTPIMWKLDSMPERLHKYIAFNPVAVFLSFCRDPLIGNVVPDIYYLVGVIYILIVLAISILMFSKYREKIVYWV